MPKVQWTTKANKQLLRIDSRYQKAIYGKGNTLIHFLNVRLDITTIEGSDGEYRLRVGSYRLKFKVIKGNPVIIEIHEVTRR